jgi:Skp family chaperone for outer membrane proteins
MRSFWQFAVFLLVCAGAPASAQTFGPPIPGLCLLSRTGAIGASRAGQSMQAQLKQMQASLSGDLAQRRNAIDQQRRQLEARQNATAPIEYQRQLAALDQQARGLEQQQNVRFIAAQERGQQQIDRALNAALGRVVTRNVCSLVVERNNTYGWNNAMDITPAVTREMDSLVQTVTLQ